jgi:hypothetical protein
MATIGAAMLGIAAAAEVYAAEPVAAEGVTATQLSYDPSFTSADAGPTPLEKRRSCIDAAMARPKVTYKPHIIHAGIRPGDPHHKAQYLRGGFEYLGLPVYCAPEYFFVSNVKQQMKKGSHWVRVGQGNLAGAWGNQKTHSSLSYWPSHPKPAYPYDECVNGHFQEDRIVITNILKEGENGHRKVIAEKKYTLDTVVQGSCKAAVQSRRLYG